MQELSKQDHDQFCCTYSALILHDEGIEITPQQMKKLIDASDNKVDAFWPSMFSKALAGVDIKGMMSGAGASAAPAGSSAPETQKQDAPKKEEEKKKEQPKEEEEEADMDMGDLFAF